MPTFRFDLIDPDKHPNRYFLESKDGHVSLAGRDGRPVDLEHIVSTSAEALRSALAEATDIQAARTAVERNVAISIVDSRAVVAVPYDGLMRFEIADGPSVRYMLTVHDGTVTLASARGDAYPLADISQNAQRLKIALQDAPDPANALAALKRYLRDFYIVTDISRDSLEVPSASFR
jgi:hypothetical protein